ncbi:LuxR C-terminal-related transcriptional regulator [Enterobacterales bacterium AE_CKDN230030158-1A_HGKHYDSX7]
MPRRKLGERLLQSSARIRLLCAPAGSGKTHVLKECANAASAEIRLCWLDLRGTGATAATLLLQLADSLALEMCSPQALADYLAACRAPLWIMLDHLPCHGAAELDESLLQLLQASSSHVRWWICCRRRPAWPLMRWLLSGELCEVGAEHLALTNDELCSLLAAQGNPLDPPELMLQTGGWFAGVSLRLLAAQLDEDPTGQERLLASYLECELLARLRHSEREILSMLACLPSFDQRLYDWLFESESSAPTLSELLGYGLFIEPSATCRGEFRIHPAVAGALAAMLPQRRRTWLHCRACQYFSVAGNLHRAIHFAILAEQPEMAVSLIERLGLESLWYAEGFAMLLRWSERLPAELRYSSPKLILLQAWALFLSGRMEEASVCGDRLANYLPQSAPQCQGRWMAAWQLLAAHIAQRNGDTLTAVELVSGALLALPVQEWVERTLAWMLLIEQAGARGSLREECTLAATALQLVREHGCVALEGMLILQQAEQLDYRGEFTRAESLVRRVIKEISDTSLPLLGRAHLHVGRCAWRAGRLEEAWENYSRARELCTGAGDPAVVWAYAGQVELAASRGDLQCAFELLGEARRTLQRRRVSTVLFSPFLELLTGKLWILQGKHARAERLATDALRRWSSSVDWPMAFVGMDTCRQFELLRARAGLSSGSDSAESLETWLDSTEKEGRSGQLCELWFALSEAHLAFGRQRKAQAALFEGLGLARKLGGWGSECHWHSFRPEIGRWVDKLDLERSEIASIDASQLSRRELSVLGMIGEGLSNQEIADRLHISLHTVKSHAQRINAKLGVCRRTQAIVRAKALGLLT